MKERLIVDDFLLVQEIVLGMGRKCKNGKVALKLDMSKAYDWVSWVLLISVLCAFGFGKKWIDMVLRLLLNCWFSVLVNGAAIGFFKSPRGLRQEDPLSPALFILSTEVLSRALNKLVENPAFKRFKVLRHCPKVTHLSYANDILIFF